MPRRAERFFRSFKIDDDVLACLLVRLFPVGEAPWYVTLDRTHWRFGKTDLNFLILGIAHQGIALPVRWRVLDKPGHSDTEARMADRAFVGERPVAVAPGPRDNDPAASQIHLPPCLDFIRHIILNSVELSAEFRWLPGFLSCT